MESASRSGNNLLGASGNREGPPDPVFGAAVLS